MPPTSMNVRKPAAATAVSDPSAVSRRTTSGRAVRANAARPANYYARPYDNADPSGGATRPSQGLARADEHGFFPALQFFSDAIAALPKEVIRQFTLMKEVEAKIHGPNEKLGEMVDNLMQYPVPSRARALHAAPSDGQGLLSFTANNSATGSASASMVNGIANNASAPTSVPASVHGEDVAHAAGEDDVEKRTRFYEMRMLTHDLLPNLDEKNVVLAEANRVLAQQLARLDSVMPYIDEEISADARLGSMTHWAYSDNRQKKQSGAAASNRRDVAATNSLAAAASAIHESDIAQARRDAVRETAREKHKGKSREHVDSDFEERPRKTTAKTARNKAAAHLLTTSSAGEPVKRRRMDKGLAAPGMERSLSGASKSAKSLREIPRSVAAEDVGRKVPKAKPAPLSAKRKGVGSAQGSPALASSPLHSSFNPASVEQPPSGRAQSARLRQNSAATNLRHERLPDEDDGRLTVVATKANGEKTNGKRKAPHDAPETIEHEHVNATTEREDKLAPVESHVADTMHASRSTSNSGKAGRGSTAGTPKAENFNDIPALIRARSTRSMRGNQEESSTEPQGARQHKRNSSNSHLVKQLAPFNRSPDMGREPHDDMDEDLDSIDGETRADREEAHASRSPLKRQPPRSRRGTGNLAPISSPPAFEEDEEKVGEDAVIVEVDGKAEHADSPALPDLEPDAAPVGNDQEFDEELEEDDESEEPGDPDDPDEPKYCYCNRGSYGEMIACDNELCAREWFHLGCTDLREPPDEAVKWYCEDCKPIILAERERGSGRGGRGRGRGAAKR